MNRRQNFLTEQSYELLSKHYANEETYWRENHLEADSESHELSMKSRLLKDACFKSLLLEYTAGCEPEKMIPLLACLVEKYESRQLLLSKYDGRINIAPLAIDDLLDQYEEFIQVLSLCILLDQPDLLVRFVGLFDRAEYFGSDALYEDLLTKVVPGRSDVDTWYPSEYSKLLCAIYADTSDEASSRNIAMNGIHHSGRRLGMIYILEVIHRDTWVTGLSKLRQSPTFTRLTIAKSNIWSTPKTSSNMLEAPLVVRVYRDLEG